MGWNDRLPEDPYWPEVSLQDDRDSYENWLYYLESQVDDTNAELSSQTLTPEDLRRLSGLRTVRHTEIVNEEETYSRKTKNVQEEIS